MVSFTRASVASVTPSVTPMTGAEAQALIGTAASTGRTVDLRYRHIHLTEPLYIPPGTTGMTVNAQGAVITHSMDTTDTTLRMLIAGYATACTGFPAWMGDGTSLISEMNSQCYNKFAFTTVTGPIAEDAASIDVASSAGIVAGDLLYICGGALADTMALNPTSRVDFRRSFVRVSSVVGTTLNLSQGPARPFPNSNNIAYKVQPKVTSFTWNGGTFHGSVPADSRTRLWCVIEACLCDGLQFNDVTVEGGSYFGINIRACHNALIDGATIGNSMEGVLGGAFAGYHILVAGSSRTTVSNTVVTMGQLAVAFNNSCGTTLDTVSWNPPAQILAYHHQSGIELDHGYGAWGTTVTNCLCDHLRVGHQAIQAPGGSFAITNTTARTWLSVFGNVGSVSVSGKYPGESLTTKYLSLRTTSYGMGWVAADKWYGTGTVSGAGDVTWATKSAAAGGWAVPKEGAGIGYLLIDAGGVYFELGTATINATTIARAGTQTVGQSSQGAIDGTRKYWLPAAEDRLSGTVQIRSFAIWPFGPNAPANVTLTNVVCDSITDRHDGYRDYEGNQGGVNLSPSGGWAAAGTGSDGFAPDGYACWPNLTMTGCTIVNADDNVSAIQCSTTSRVAAKLWMTGCTVTQNVGAKAPITLPAPRTPDAWEVARGMGTASTQGAWDIILGTNTIGGTTTSVKAITAVGPGALKLNSGNTYKGNAMTDGTYITVSGGLTTDYTEAGE